jgi:UDP:flavonoid glycosyltransferase YjiC (YdhE family)
MATPIKPLVLICATPVSGHIIPMRTIAKELVTRGYEVCFVTGSGYRQYVEEIGASFVPVEGYGDFHDLRARELDPDCKYFDNILWTRMGIQCVLRTTRPVLTKVSDQVS